MSSDPPPVRVASLTGPRPTSRVEILVVAARDRIVPCEGPLVPALPILWIEAEGRSGVPRLRRIGLDRARAPIVLFTEDSCVFEPGWAERWLAAFEDSRVEAATGAVAPDFGDGGSVWDWSVFFVEYAPFLEGRRVKRGQEPLIRARAVARNDAGTRPLGEHPKRLAGNHFAIRRGLAPALDGERIHEGDVAAIVGRLALARSSARARHVRHDSAREAIGDRFRFGFEYGRLRARGQSPWLRLAALFAGPAILLAQTIRLTATVAARGRFLLPFFKALPVTLGLLTAWSLGEWLGWTSAPAPVPSLFPFRRRHGAAGRRAGPPTGRSGSRRPRCRSGQARV